MEGEAPWIETNSNYLLEENMTFCVDIFLGSKETETGLRMEDVVCITKDGVENLTNYPRELFEIECKGVGEGCLTCTDASCDGDKEVCSSHTVCPCLMVIMLSAQSIMPSSWETIINCIPNLSLSIFIISDAFG